MKSYLYVDKQSHMSLDTKVSLLNKKANVNYCSGEFMSTGFSGFPPWYDLIGVGKAFSKQTKKQLTIQTRSFRFKNY